MKLMKVEIENKRDLAQRLLNGEVLYSNTDGDRIVFDEDSSHNTPFIYKSTLGETERMDIAWDMKVVYKEQTLKGLLKSNHKVLCWVWDSGDRDEDTYYTFIHSYDGVWFYDLEGIPWNYAEIVKEEELVQKRGRG